MHSYWWINAMLLVPLAAIAAVFATRSVRAAAYVIGIVAASIELALTVVVAFSYPANACLLYTSPSPRDRTRSRMPSSA